MLHFITKTADTDLGRFINRFVKDILPETVARFTQRQISLNQFKDMLKSSITRSVIWKWYLPDFPHLKQALITQIDCIKIATEPFIQEENETHWHGQFVIFSHFISKPTITIGDLIIDTGTEKWPVSQLANDLLWIAHRVHDDISGDEAIIMEVTNNPIKEAYSKDIGNLVERSSLNSEHGAQGSETETWSTP